MAVVEAARHPDNISNKHVSVAMQAAVRSPMSTAGVRRKVAMPKRGIKPVSINQPRRGTDPTGEVG